MNYFLLIISLSLVAGAQPKDYKVFSGCIEDVRINSKQINMADLKLEGEAMPGCGKEWEVRRQGENLVAHDLITLCRIQMWGYWGSDSDIMHIHWLTDISVIKRVLGYKQVSRILVYSPKHFLLRKQFEMIFDFRFFPLRGKLKFELTEIVWFISKLVYFMQLGWNELWVWKFSWN